MVEDVLLTARLDDGHRLVYHLQQTGVGVVVAGWVLTTEHGWRLYIAGDYREPHGYGEAFGVVYRHLLDVGRAAFDSSAVRLVRRSDPVTDELLAIRGRGKPGRIAAARVRRIDGRGAKRVYVYPQVQLLSPIEVVRTVDELATGPNPAQLLAVTFRDGQRLIASPVGTSLRFAGGTTEATVTLRKPDGQVQDYPAAEITGVSRPEAAAA